MDKRKLLGVGRKLLIVVLLAVAVLLSWETGYLHGLKERLYPIASEDVGSSDVAETAYSKPSGMILPSAAVVCLPDGGRCGVLYHKEDVTAVYHRFSADLGEALGSAGVPSEMTEAEFLRDCLNGCGLFLRYHCPCPLELLTAWLGAEMTGASAEHRAELLFLLAEDSVVELCYRTDDGTYYRCATAVSAEGLRSRTAEYTSNGTRFAFETAELSGGDPCTVLPQGAMTAAVVNAAVPLPTGEEQNLLLQAMGMHSYFASSYSEADGTVVFLDEEATLRLSPDGNVFFRRPAMSGRNASQGITAAVKLAWRAAEQSVGRSCGDAELYFSGAEYNETQQSVTVLLDYAVNNIPVRLAAGHAAEVTLRNDTVVQARLVFRRFTVTEELETLLPILQANAIAAAADSSAELIYADQGERMNCVWVKTDG